MDVDEHLLLLSWTGSEQDVSASSRIMYIG